MNFAAKCECITLKKIGWNSVNANLRMGLKWNVIQCDKRMWWEAGCKRLFVRFYWGLTCWCWFLPHFLGGFPPYFLGFLPFFFKLRMWWDSGRRLFVRFCGRLTCWCWFLPDFSRFLPDLFDFVWFIFCSLLLLIFLLRMWWEIVCEILLLGLTCCCCLLPCMAALHTFWIISWFLPHFFFGFPPDSFWISIFFIKDIMSGNWQAGETDLLLLPLALHGMAALHTFWIITRKAAPPTLSFFLRKNHSGQKN